LLEAVTRKRPVKTLLAGKTSRVVEISDGATIKCDLEFCTKMVNKTTIQSKSPSRVPLRHVAISSPSSGSDGKSRREPAEVGGKLRGLLMVPCLG
jgi:hypothetical protein